MDPNESPGPESAGADGKTTGAPVPAVPTSETTPIWARTVPVVEPLQTSSKPPSTVKDTAEELLPPDLSDLEPERDPSVTAPELEPPGTVTKQEKIVESEPSETTEPSEPDSEPLPALPMQKADPDWAHTEPPVEPADENDPKRPTTMQKPAPVWAQTVPAPPGEMAEDLPAAEQGPSRASAGTPAEAKPAWTPASTASSTPPVKDSRADDEVWPPEPPTERAMPAWPPSSTISEMAESTDIPASTIPSASWSDEFDSKAGTANVQLPPRPSRVGTPVDKAKVAPAEPPPTVIPAASKPPAAPKSVAAPAEQAPTVVPAKPMAAPIEQAPTIVPEPPKPAIAAPKPTPTPAPPPPAAVKPATVPPPTPPVKTQPTAPAPPAADVWAEPAPAASPPPAPAQTKPEDNVDWPSPVNVPAWAPQVHIGPTHPQYVPPAEEAPAAKAASAAAPAPAAPPPPKPAATPQPATAAQSPGASDPAKVSSGSWAVVDQKRKVDPSKLGPTPEDRSYAEWFAWAKRGGAPASACHAAAQGAFQALAGGKDVAVAVQWATAAMARPPVPVTTARQTYCAWFSLANIDLNLDQHKAHLFATAAVQALDAGGDASSAHATGLKAAGVA